MGVDDNILKRYLHSTTPIKVGFADGYVLEKNLNGNRPDIEIFVPMSFVREYNIFLKKRSPEIIPNPEELWEFFRVKLPGKGMMIKRGCSNSSVDEVVGDIEEDTHKVEYSWVSKKGVYIEITEREMIEQ